MRRRNPFRHVAEDLLSFADDHLIPLVDEGPGNSAYLADLGDGRALAVDASRDLRALREAAARRGLRIAFAADTHLHADFLSGAVQLAALPGATPVWPTHGAGSFCSAPPGAERTTTIGAERAGNPLLGAPDEDAFARQLLASLGSYPVYFDRLADANRRGPSVVACTPGLAPLTPAAVRSLLASGGWLVDARTMADFAAGHLPGALSIPLRGQFATWLGWLVPPGVPLCFVLGPGQDPAEVAWQSLKVGYEQLAGQLAGGMSAWRAGGGPVQAVELVTADRIGGRAVLDVRQAGEYQAGHIPGAIHCELGALAATAPTVPHGAVVMCGHGERAMTAASLLRRAGHSGPAVPVGGVADWSAATGRPLGEGS